MTGLYFVGQKYAAVPASDWVAQTRAAPFAQARTELSEYFAGKRKRFDVPLAPSGTAFQTRVWQALGAIPCGTTRTYAELAQCLGAPRSVRAVAAAVGRNPIALVVPCHRVIGSDGSLTGYAGGLTRKHALLELEGGFWEARVATWKTGGSQRSRALCRAPAGKPCGTD